MVPFTDNLENFLLEFHKKNGHRNSNSLRKYILNNNNYYYGIVNDIEKIVKNFSICNIKLHYDQRKKREPSNIILFNKPKYRYVGDLSDLPTEIKQYSGFNFSLTILDYFSKFIDSFLLKKKEQNNISKCLENFIKFYGAPLEFGYDNGREFINCAVKKISIKH